MSETNAKESLIWLRLGSTEIWNRNTLFFGFVISALLALFLEAIRFEDFSLAWMLAQLASFVLAALYAIACIQMVMAYKPLQRFRAEANLIIAGTAMGAKYLSATFFEGLISGTEANLTIQIFLNGLFVGMAIFIVYANLLGAKSENTGNKLRKVNLTFGFQPTISGVVTFLAWYFLARQILPEASTIDLFLASLIYVIVLFVFKFVARLLKPVSVSLAMILVPAICSIATLPSYYLLYQIPQEITDKPFMPGFVVLAALLSIGLGYAAVLDESKSEKK
ncbi:MAG: hypothetical protein ACKOFA_01020 [Rhodoluna sp.]